MWSTAAGGTANHDPAQRLRVSRKDAQGARVALAAAYMLTFIAGLVIGAWFGATAMAICVAGKTTDTEAP